ncbi:anti-sigma B factor antagonist [Spinactinospora alkalitolerans]|uniref:Anti-sigma factor antagonist n=1 Tax=Spinactinospora alkalitolerans TaxID=687207 RepID=A0A852TM08_9ACTN|nr:STAS domain-containing protein [Spinactinospora alkalitolerans]NYE45286.1 anti-sigma B factor antagonist [Spinactinospora alkalitolerans]
MPALQITIRNHDDGTVIVLDGEIDIATEDEFHRAVLDAMSAEQHGRVVLDCTRLSFIDSSGLRVLIQCHKAGKEHDSRVFIAAASERVTQILHVTAIDTRIPVYPTVESALAAPVETSRQR